MYPSMQWSRHPLGRHPPAQYMLGYTHPNSAYWDTVNKQAVRIPLECILVKLSHYTYQVFSHTKPAFNPFESDALASAFT